MRILGVMTGTSCDGLDAACADFCGITFKPLWAKSRPYPKALRERVFAAQSPKAKLSLKQWGELHRDLGMWMAHALRDILNHASSGRPEAIACHGQTVAHFPAARKRGFTLQLGDPSRIAEATGLTVISNFRDGDMAAGGEGAPLAPRFHELIAGKRTGIAIHNLGGISNLTYVGPKNLVIAFDTGPGNLWIDAAAELASGGGLRCDLDGKIARDHKADSRAVERVLRDRYFSRKPPKSTGRDDFHFEKLLSATSARDGSLVATATAITVESIGRAYSNFILKKKLRLEAIYFSGGGARNPFLMESLRTRLSGVRVGTVDELGVDSHYLEANAFAYFGFLALRGMAIGGRGPVSLARLRPRISLLAGTGPESLPKLRNGTVNRVREITGTPLDASGLFWRNCAMPGHLRVLMVEDSDFDAELLLAMLERGGYEVQHTRVETAKGLSDALQKDWDIVIADYNLPQFDALAALDIVKASGKDIPFIIVSGGIGESTAVAAMKAGAHDYLMKGNLARLVPVVERELREAENRRSKRRTEDALRESELRYRLLWETATDAVLLLTPDAIVEFANPAVKEIFGYEPQEMVGQSVDILQPFFESLNPEINWKRFIRVAHGGKAPGAIEATGKHKDGREICVEIVFSALELGGRRLFVCFIRDITERKKTEHELMANQEQFRVAHEIQQHLFPKSSPQVPGFEIAGASYPAEATGGDYFDYLTMLNDCTGIVIGDVTGHGVGPALLMAETRAYLRILARNREDPAEILYRTNLVLAEDVGSERYVTLTLLRLNVKDKTVSYANAGHIPGYILDKDGATKQILKRTGPPLGLRGDAQYGLGAEIALVPGDLILLLTDGFEEALSPEEEFFGMQRVLDHIKKHRNDPAHQIVRSLYHSFREFTEAAPQLDDLTVVVVKVIA